MKRSVYLYAITLGTLMSALVIFSNIVSPTPGESDDEYGALYLVLYLVLFLLFAIGGFIATDKSEPFKSGALGGAVTALIAIGMTLITFVVIDIVFLDIVSQQIDKINAFRNQTAYTNMRDFINSGLLPGLAFGLIAAVVFGSLFGLLGATLRTALTMKGSRR